MEKVYFQTNCKLELLKYASFFILFLFLFFYFLAFFQQPKAGHVKGDKSQYNIILCERGG